MLGRTLGNYSIERELGRGGMGVVYAGTHGLLRRTAAIKVLLPKFSLDQEIVERFFNEARAAAAIKHPGIVEIYDFGFTEGSAYIVMELCEGESLATRMRRRRAMPVVAALTLARQIAGTLAAAHKAEIVHRDLKPDNVFVVSDADVAGGERIKLLDFGIAKLAGDAAGPSKTTTGVIMGTPHYMSPEQCRGAGLVDHRSDLYSLGCILFELVCGRLPFVGEGSGDIIGSHLLLPPPAPSSIAPAIPADVERLILRLLAKKPEDRFATADALIDELARVIAGVPPSLEVRTRTPDSLAPTLPSDELSAPVTPHSPTRADSLMLDDLATDRDSAPRVLAPTDADAPALDDERERKAGKKTPEPAPPPPRRVTEPATAGKQPNRNKAYVGIAGAVVATSAVVIGLKLSAHDGARNDTKVIPGNLHEQADAGVGDKDTKESPRRHPGGSGSGSGSGDRRPDNGSGSGSSASDDRADLTLNSVADPEFYKIGRELWMKQDVDRMMCLKKALGASPKRIGGMVVVHIGVSIAGKIDQLQVTGPDAALVDCIQALTAKLTFPVPKFGPTLLTFPVELGDGAVEESQLYKFLQDSELGPLLQCYGNQRLQHKKLSRFNAELSIDETGKLTRLVVKSPRDATLDACMQKEYAGHRFPRPKAGTPITVGVGFQMEVVGAGE